MNKKGKIITIVGATVAGIMGIAGITKVIIDKREVAELAYGVVNPITEKIQRFDAQFTQYEGRNKGLKTKEIYDIVMASNATDEAHQVIITGIISKDDIIDKEDYIVTLVYADEDSSTTERSYVCEINIEKVSEITEAN